METYEKYLTENSNAKKQMKEVMDMAKEIKMKAKSFMKSADDFVKMAKDEFKADPNTDIDWIIEKMDGYLELLEDV